MSAEIIPFPKGRVHLDRDIVEALEKLAMCEATIADGIAANEPHKVRIGEIMRDWWEKELVRLGGVPPRCLRKDGVGGANP